MQIVLDECVPVAIGMELALAGFAVEQSLAMNPAASDETVLALATASGALLVTEDLDFGELVVHQSRSASGVLLVRLAGLTNGEKAERVVEVVRTNGDTLLECFTVVAQRATRMRPLAP